MKKIDLWERFNTHENDQGYDILKKILANASPDDPIAKMCEKECDIQMRVLAIQLWLEDLDSDKTQFHESMQKPSSVDINYCKKRCAEDTSVLLKWHYYIVLFFAERKNWLKKAIPLILQSARMDDGSNATIYLALAFNLNKLYGCGQKVAIKNVAVYLLMHKQNTKFPGVCVRIIYKLEKSPEIKKESCDRLMALVENQDDIESENSLNHAIKAAPSEDQISTKLAKYYEELGDEQNEPLVKMVRYTEAQKHFRGKSDRKNIANKIKNATKSVKLVEITTETKIDKLSIPGENNFQRQRYLVRLFGYLLPSVATMEQAAKKLQQHSIDSAFANKIKISDSGLLSSTNISKEQSEFIKMFERIIIHNDNVLSVSVRDYEKDGKITVNDHMNYLQSFALHDKPILKLIECGIKRHYERDYVSSIHILIPQIEHTLRKLLEQKGINTMASTNKDMKYTLLKDLLSNSQEIIGSDFTRHLTLKLADINSINLRNMVSHSFYSKFEGMKDHDALHVFSHPTSLSLILIIELLTRLSLETT